MPVSPRGERSTRRQDVEKTKIRDLSRHLATSLQYAKLKVDHGWTKQNLNEVENLYNHYRKGPRPALLAQQRAAAAARQRSQARAASQAAGASGNASATQPLLPPATTRRKSSAPAATNGATADDDGMDVDDDSEYEDEDGGDDEMVLVLDDAGGGASSKTPSVPPRSATPPRLEPSALPRTPAPALPAPRVAASAPSMTAARPGVLGSPVTVTPARTRAPSQAMTPASALPAFSPSLIASITQRGVDPGVLQEAIAKSRGLTTTTRRTAPLPSASKTNGSSKPAASSSSNFLSSGTGVGLGTQKPLTYDTFFKPRDYSLLINSSNPTIAKLSQRLKDMESPTKADGTSTALASALPSATIPYGSGGASGSGNASAATTPPVNPVEAAARAARLGVSRRPSPTSDEPTAPATRASRRTSAPRQLR